MDRQETKCRGPLTWFGDLYLRDRVAALSMIAILALAAFLSLGLVLFLSGALPPWFYSFGF